MFYGYDGHLGYTKKSVLYDAKGRNVKYTYLDNGDRPVLQSTEKIAGWSSTYDDAGHEVRRKFFGADEKPARLNGEFLAWTATYEDGHIAERHYIGYDGQLGFTNKRVSYDARGNETRYRYFDDEGRPAINSNLATAGFFSEYDDAGHETKREYFGLDGKRARLNGEYAGWVAKYNNGRLVSRTYYDYDEGRVYRRTRSEFDAKGNEITFIYLDEQDQPVVNPVDRVAGWTREPRRCGK